MHRNFFLRSFTTALFFTLVALGAPTVTRAADPTMHEIYSALQAGEVARARQMVDVVLEHHPDSAKAHFVAAEVAVRAGDRKVAQRELSAAESLAPGLTFATPESVSAVRSAIAGRSSTRTMIPAQARGGSLPWGMIALVVLLIAGVAYALSRRRSAAQVNNSGLPYVPGSGSQGAAPMPAGPVPSGGSGLMGSLATGAALGAGVVAGEVLAHRLFGGGDAQAGTSEVPIEPAAPPLETDFGISDSDWDDNGAGGSAGGDDWS